MSSFTFINGLSGHPNLKHDFEVHRTGCRDLDKYRRRRFSMWTIEAETVDAAIAEQVAEFDRDEMDYGADSFYKAPCCR